MDKEKEIEGMADLIGHNKYVRTNEQVACILFDEGYRFADEVRKETAKDIADWLEFRYNHGDYFNFLLTIAQTIRKNYGVEVDE